MQGIKLLFDQDSINQLKRQYDEVIKELENKKVHVDFSDANRSINELTNKVRELQGINLKSNTLDTNIKEETRNLDELIKKYTELGYKVNIKNQQFKLINPEDIENSKRELNNFVIELEKTKGIIDKITYTAQHNEKGLFTGFTADNNVIRTDNSVKIAEQLAKEEEKLANAIGKVREQSELKAKAEQRELEKNQAQAQNKVLEQEYLMKQKHQKWLQTLGADVTPEGFKFDVKKSTYADMERLAKDFGDVNAEIKKIDVQPIEKSGDVVRNVTYRVRDSKDKWHEYKLAVVEAGEDGTASLRKLDQGTRDVINRQVSLGSRLKNAWIAVTSFASVTTVFYAAVHEVQKAVSMMNDLDKSMTNIQMITGKTRNEVQGLVGDYNDLATELHTTTKEMMSGAEEFLRAGKSVEETQNLLKASTIGAAISGQTNSETSEQLIAISNGFKLNTNDAKELMGVIDKLSAVDNSSSTSFKELATAMQYTSSSAQNAGVSMEDLISYIGIVSSVSRRSAESIGTSFRNIFSRYSAVSAGKDIDDEGEKINDVEKALNNLGIAIRSDATHFKDFSTVIGELNKKWSTLNDLQKNQAVGALAGTKNRENLLILMDNMDQVKKLQDAMANSTNSAEKKFEEAYGESTQAKVADFKHQVELFWQGVMNNKAINFFIDLGTQIIKVFRTINEQSVGTKIALVATSFALIEVIRNIKSVTKAISDSKVAISGLDRVLKLLFGTTASGAGIVKALKTAFSGLKTAIVALFTTPVGATIIALTSAITLCIIAITKHIKH
jgi:TP901 family phage tail tape measure protein